MLEILFRMLVMLMFLGGNNTNKVEVIICNDIRNRPTPRSEYTFWYYKEYLDTISLRGGNIPSLIEKRIKGLKKEEFTYELSVEAALIIHTSISCDTLYTNRFFHLWQTKEGNFVDSSGQLARMFSGLNMIHYFDSDN